VNGAFDLVGWVGFGHFLLRPADAVKRFVKFFVHRSMLQSARDGTGTMGAVSALAMFKSIHAFFQLSRFTVNRKNHLLGLFG
jgi:hypothetical protein